MSWDHPSKKERYFYFFVIFVLSVALLYLARADTCISQEAYNQCQTNLTTKSKLVQDQGLDLQQLRISSDTMRQKYSQCNSTLYKLQNEFNDINKSYSQLLLEYQNLEDNYTLCHQKLNQSNNQSVVEENQVIVLGLTLPKTSHYYAVTFYIISFSFLISFFVQFGLKLKPEIDSPKIKNGLNWFLAVFTAAMGILSFLNFSLLISLVIAFFIALIVATIVYLVTSEN